MEDKKTFKERVEGYQQGTSYGADPLIDPLIKPLCRLLNDHGIYTVGSCSGHIKVRRKKKTPANQKTACYVSGGVQFFVTKSDMRILYHLVEEIKKKSSVHIDMFVSNQQRNKEKIHNLYNMLLIDFYFGKEHVTDDDLYLFHQFFYHECKNALETKKNCHMPAGQLEDRHARLVYAMENRIPLPLVPKINFLFELENLTWN